MAELCNLHQVCTASRFLIILLPKCNTQTNALCLGGGELNLSSIGNYNFLYVKEPSIISSQFSRLYVCNLLEVYTAESGRFSRKISYLG